MDRSDTGGYQTTPRLIWPHQVLNEWSRRTTYGRTRMLLADLPWSIFGWLILGTLGTIGLVLMAFGYYVVAAVNWVLRAWPNTYKEGQ